MIVVKENRQLNFQSCCSNEQRTFYKKYISIFMKTSVFFCIFLKIYRNVYYLKRAHLCLKMQLDFTADCVPQWIMYNIVIDSV